MSRGGGCNDYSKWDHIGDDDSDDDDDDDENENDPHHPARVTRLDQPSRVTLQPGSDDLLVQSQQPTLPQKMEFIRPKKDDDNDEKQVVVGDSSGPPSHWIEKGGVTSIVDDDVSVLYWCQDRGTVTIRVPLHDKKRKYRCHVSNMVSYVDRCNAVGFGTASDKSVNQQFEITATVVQEKQELSVLQGDLAYPAYLPEHEDDVDWSIETTVAGDKFMVVTLLKATPMIGLTLWWKKPLQQCPDEINIDWTNNTDNNSFPKVWKQAHEQFKQNMQEKQKHSV
jgi:hypothetical protein